MKEKTALSHAKVLKLDKDYAQAAKAASLKYVSDNNPGITLRQEIYVETGRR